MKESGISIMLFEQIKLQGKSISEVSRETGISRNTIKKYLKEGEQSHKSKGKRLGSKLDSFKELIDHLLKQGIYNCQVIFERLQEFGYQGGISIVKDYVKGKVRQRSRSLQRSSGMRASLDSRPRWTGAL